MSFLIWAAQRRWPWSPQWFQRWQHQQRIRWLQARQIPAMLAVQEAGVGLSEVWAGPGTSDDEILRWYTEQISAAPRPLAPSTDQFRLLMARCTQAEWEAAQEPGSVVRLSADRCVAHWTGHRSRWWWDGHDTIARAISLDHDGLYIALNAVGTVFDAPLTTSVGEHHGIGNSLPSCPAVSTKKRRWLDAISVWPSARRWNCSASARPRCTAGRSRASSRR